MRTWLILFILTFSLRTQAQTSVYHPFPDSGAVWNIDCITGPSLCLSFPHEYYSYVLSGDTVINSVTYHKLIVPFVVTTDTCPPNNQAGYAGAIRQNIAAKKVYYVAPSHSIEQLLYDFDLHVGDSTVMCSGPWPYTMWVQSEDSVLISNNYRKSWWITSIFGQGYGIIEGIGSTSGLLYYCPPIDPPICSLTCFEQYGNGIFPDSIASCNIITSANISVKTKLACLSPNPFHTTTTLEIKNKEFSNAELKIYDRMGRLVQRQIINSSSTIIHRNLLADGIYFYQLVSDGGQMVGGKFVIE